MTYHCLQPRAEFSVVLECLCGLGKGHTFLTVEQARFHN